ncbi:MAG: hypothetical protein C5B43_01855 [Verrucomicrobia bacterium]|nr:MAG: hypothetical protein C5B43_01855 [Verrucomicrobiota bacterium]
MKNVFKKSITIFLAMSSLFWGYANRSYGVTENKVNEKTAELNNDKMKEESILYSYLCTSLFFETLTTLIQEKRLCDFCAFSENHSLSFPSGFPSYLKELDLYDRDSESLLKKIIKKISSIYFSEHEDKLFDSNRNRQCNLCNLIHTFKFRELRNKLFTKLDDLIQNENKLLSEQDEEIAEAHMKILKEFKIDSKEELLSQKIAYETLFNQIKEIGDFPNILDNLLILKAVSNAVFSFLEDYDKNKDSRKEFAEAGLILSFAGSLANHKKFLEENAESLLEIERIANNGFKIGEKEETEIKSLDEIIIETNRIQNNKKLEEKTDVI